MASRAPRVADLEEPLRTRRASLTRRKLGTSRHVLRAHMVPVGSFGRVRAAKARKPASGILGHRSPVTVHADRLSAAPHGCIRGRLRAPSKRRHSASGMQPPRTPIRQGQAFKAPGKCATSIPSKRDESLHCQRGGLLALPGARDLQRRLATSCGVTHHKGEGVDGQLRLRR